MDNVKVVVIPVNVGSVLSESDALSKIGQAFGVPNLGAVIATALEQAGVSAAGIATAVEADTDECDSCDCSDCDDSFNDNFGEILETDENADCVKYVLDVANAISVEGEEIEDGILVSAIGDNGEDFEESFAVGEGEGESVDLDWNETEATATVRIYKRARPNIVPGRKVTA